jgi:AmmeMemoRadiSam system protein A/AmmeMemoRadiSam system protein B
MSILAAFMVPHPPMIIPAVGRGSEKQVQETIDAYERVGQMIADLKPETIIITSPHTIMYSDYFHISPGRKAKGSFSNFGAPQVRFEESYDEALADQICAIASQQDFPAGFLGERDRNLDHGTMVPLWFIRKHYDGGKIIRVGLSGFPLTMHYQLGQMIAEAAEQLDRRVVFVASGDLSHKLQTYGPYGFAAEGPVYDDRIMDVCSRGAFGELFDFDETFCDKAAECGHRSFVIMAGTMDGRSVKAEQYSHQDVTGVGYGVCSFYAGEQDESRHFLDAYLDEQAKVSKEKQEKADDYVKLARKTIETYIEDGKVISIPEGLPEEMLKTQAGAFVSIHENGMLRGCIGTILPVTGSVAQEIIDNAVSAATRDPRFDPITPEELAWLEINVDVLSTPEKIDSPEELDVKKYGVIVSCGARKGLLLPDLDGVDTVEQQIKIAMQKGGIRPGEDIELERFTVTRHI